MAALTEIDSLEILVIVDNEVDPISTYSNPAVQATGNVMHIGMRSQTLVSDRGDATKEIRMDRICCGAHGLSLMIVCFRWQAASRFLLNRLSYARLRPLLKETKDAPCSSTPAPTTVA